MKHELMLMLEKESVLCVWKNGDMCSLQELPEYLEKNGPEFALATILDEEDMVRLGGAIQTIFAKKKKTSTVN